MCRRGIPSTPLSLGDTLRRGQAWPCNLSLFTGETGWSKEDFLSYCCAHKAGLAADAWKDPDTEVYLFTADVFGADFKDI